MRFIGVGPLALAVSDIEFKRAVHILETETDDDLLIKAYLEAAIEVVETACRRPMLPRSVEFMTPAGFWTCWWVPVAPVESIDRLSYLDEGGAWVDILAADYSVSGNFDEPVLKLGEDLRSSALGSKPLRVQATVGYLGATYPRAMKQAVILMVKEWFEAGIAVDEAVSSKLSFGISTLIKQHRYARPLVVA